MNIDTDALQAQKEGLERLLIGYRTVIASPDTTPFEKEEAQQGMTDNTSEWQRTTTLLDAATVYFDNGGHKKQQAPKAVIDALKRLSDNVSLVVGDFEEPVLTADSGTIVLQ